MRRSIRAVRPLTVQQAPTRPVSPPDCPSPSRLECLKHCPSEPLRPVPSNPPAATWIAVRRVRSCCEADDIPRVTSRNDPLRRSSPASGQVILTSVSTATHCQYKGYPQGGQSSPRNRRLALVCERFFFAWMRRCFAALLGSSSFVFAGGATPRGRPRPSARARPGGSRPACESGSTPRGARPPLSAAVRAAEATRRDRPARTPRSRRASSAPPG